MSEPSPLEQFNDYLTDGLDRLRRENMSAAFSRQVKVDNVEKTYWIKGIQSKLKELFEQI